MNQNLDTEDLLSRVLSVTVEVLSLEDAEIELMSNLVEILSNLVYGRISSGDLVWFFHFFSVDKLHSLNNFR